MDNSVEALASVIQLAIGPVFLLAGIAGFLNVMSGRLGRIIDRARQVESMIRAFNQDDVREKANAELKVLWRRSDIINRAIGFCVASALFVCAVVVSVFIGDFWDFHIAELVVGLFVAALLFLITALLLFLKEVQIATRILKPGGVLENQ
ncbi:DUF2721 domain-containing protein [Paraneptunicella aestuarii]|uniref:DUF2721 domain-containing protein n=1 Tax=Paraneptunicella aestuarii TaxID=2831148 RepID=UPI001E2F6509|nr:DUF2721 domain-containing protein [Paraneptunicella aestuarii]UAA37374.1 DUF2721 domain-containing protein [Paraneptunicella aestuarii]